MSFSRPSTVPAGRAAANLAGVEQSLHCRRRLRQRRLRIGCVQIEEVDPIGVQPNEAFVALTQQCLGPTVFHLDAVLPVNPALGRNDQLVATMPQRASNQAIALPVQAVAVRGVQEIDAAVHRRLQRGEAIRIGHIQAGDTSNRPAPHRDGRDSNSGVGDFTKWQRHVCFQFCMA